MREAEQHYRKQIELLELRAKNAEAERDRTAAELNATQKSHVDLRIQHEEQINRLEASFKQREVCALRLRGLRFF